MSFFQVDRGVFTSSVWIDGTPEERVLWIWLLGNCDDEGVVRHREIAIADGAKLPRPAVEAALAKFSEPDPDSRTRDNEGRKIGRTDEGFVRILNREFYYSKDYSTPRWRRWKDRKRANALANDPTRMATKDKDKDKDKDLNSQDQRSSSGSSFPSATTTPKKSKPKAEPDLTAKESARSYLAVLGAVAGRKFRTLSPDVVKAAGARLAEGWKPWQLSALPILLAARQKNTSNGPDVYLRNGEHPRTRNGNTYGGYYWLARVFEQADGARLDSRLCAIAEQAGVLKELESIGVIVEESAS